MGNETLTYKNYFLNPSSNEQWLTEVFCLPRYKSSLFPANTYEEIDQGYKSFKSKPKVQVPIQLLNESGKRGEYNKLLCNLFRKDDNKYKKWLLTVYPYGRSFLQFDIDRHYQKGMTPQEKAEIDNKARKEVENINDMASDLGGTVVWTTSPGNIIDDEHVQGLYGWLKLDRHLWQKEYKHFVKALKSTYTIDCETPRVVRLPGQRFVEIANPETFEIIQKIDNDKPQSSMGWFLSYWQEANAINVSKFNAIYHSIKETNSKKTEKVVQVKVKKAKPKSPIKYGIQLEKSTLQDALAEKNTFISATKHRICSELTIKYQGQSKYKEQAIQQGMKKLIHIRPGDSNTCSNPELLYSTMKNWMKWYFKEFDIAKCDSSKRDIADKERIGSSLLLDEKMLLRYLKKHSGLTYKEQGIVASVFGKMKKWNGRIFCEELYRLSGDKKVWFKLFNPGKYNNNKKQLGKLSSFLIIADEWKTKKCRQYGWSNKVVNGVNQLLNVQQDVASIKEEPEKNKKQVVGKSKQNKQNPETSCPYSCYAYQVSENQPTFEEKLLTINFKTEDKI
jgi:hypothetical protein